ncbi:MAG: PA14 domain-containing protein [Planctomycetota bacterium]
MNTKNGERIADARTRNHWARLFLGAALFAAPIPSWADFDRIVSDQRQTVRDQYAQLGAVTFIDGKQTNSAQTILSPVSKTQRDEPVQPPNEFTGDCNANGIPDDCDLTCDGDCNVYPQCGQGSDCQSDDIPDDCQLYGLEQTYRVDDGTSEYGLRSAGTHIAWMNNFVVAGEAKLIDAIELTFVNVVEGAPATVYLWSDPDGDGDPFDAQVLAFAPTLTVNAPGSVFVEDLVDTYVGENGTSFFVGVIMEYPSEDAFPCPLDGTDPITTGVGWLIGKEGPFDPNNLTQDHIEYARIEDAVSIPTHLVVRAIAKTPINDCNFNLSPDDCDIAGGGSNDADSNGIPDECEDCNNNGIPDSQDVDPADPDGNGETSLDCNSDGIPDECQLLDNDCNTDDIPDDCQLASNDCNDNETPDECDIASGASVDTNGNAIPDDCEDCDGNGITDECDVSCAGACTDIPGCGLAEDCQPDGIPDACQLGEPDLGLYSVDDGSREGVLGIGDPGDIAWLNHFTIEEGSEIIAEVQVAHGTVAADWPMFIHIWSDPDGDGDPTDAQVISTTESNVVFGTETYQLIDIDDIFVGPAGTSFFVGVFISDDTGTFGPITRDTSSPQGESWVAAQRYNPPSGGEFELDPNNLSAGEFFGELADLGFPGNCLIRARGFEGTYSNDCDGNAIPDECDIASGAADDIDFNGVPDSCEDCNENSIPDGCDVTCDGACSGVVGCGTQPDCNGNGVPDACDNLESDCNNNGIPDPCDVPPIGGLADCNGDLIPDECQLVDNDCNNTNIPDECELEGPPVPQYVLDDGSSEDSIGLSNGGDLGWLNHFEVIATGETIKSIQVSYAGIASGTPADVYLWSDPNGDGNPNDAQTIVSAAISIQSPATDSFMTVNIPETFIGPAGTSFFAGTIVTHSVPDLPMPIDLSTSNGESWLAGGSGALDPDDLSSATLYGRVTDFGFAGNAMVRVQSTAPAPPNDCNSNGIPDECDLSSGFSADCNNNSVPDECDVPPIGDTSLDCNANLIPDECIFEQDCDSNGIPDDCQDNDCDDNGLPEPCELSEPNGLVAQYGPRIGEEDFERVLTRIDPTIDFDWGGGGSPDPIVPVDDFMARWTGILRSQVSGVHQFHMTADDGVRLWINGELIIDEWHPANSEEYTATTAILGGAANHIRVEFYEGGGDARVRLRWTPPGGQKEVIPTEALSPMQDCNGNLIPDACDASPDVNANGLPDECEDCNGNGIFDEQDIIGGTSEDCNNNGLADECEVIPGGFADCNTNGIPDDCELDTNDCQGDGIHDSCQAISQGLVAHYFSNPYWAGPPDAVRIDSTIDFDWGDFSPDVNVSNDNFTARWIGALKTQSAGSYQFRIERDDYFGLYLEGVLITDEQNTVSVDLPADSLIPIRGEFREDGGGARVTLFWTPPLGSEEVIPSTSLFPMIDNDDNGIADACELGDCNGNGVADNDDIKNGNSIDCDFNGIPDECQGNCDCDGNGYLDSCEATKMGLVGQYYSSADDGLFTERLLVRIDATVDYNWGSGSPAPQIGENNFAVRWTGTVTTTAAAGLYTFLTHTDDGARLWVDGQQLIDEWVNQGGTTHSGSINLAANSSYLITMEYYESGGNAEAFLRWEPPGGIEEIIPASALSPLADADGDGLPDVCAMPDCNNNGVTDSEDIAMGTSEDCNDNCTPDECDLETLVAYGQAYYRFEDAGGSTIEDSGPFSLDGSTNGSPFRVADVAADPVPQNDLANTQSLDLNWQSTSDGGLFDAPDTGGHLTMGDTNFTLEAWVKLSHVSNTSTNDQRQYLFQKKPLPSQDGLVDYAFLVQRGNHSNPNPNFGKNSDFTGRELQLVFGAGSGTSVWGITSNLEISDTDWHHVSVAFDTVSNFVRFGVDDQFEIVSFNDQTRTTNAGPLRAGSHQNGVGVDNFFLRGAVDEIRITRTYLPVDELLNQLSSAGSYSEDCNGNNVPDECDIADMASIDFDENGIPDECEDCNNNLIPDPCDVTCEGTCADEPGCGQSVDCNANGTPDECDIDDVTSGDCNSDNIPDECQLVGSDCNDNNLPDECDLNSGFSEDCNTDNFPDECQLDGNDCNANGTIDSCDLASGTSQDCNETNIPDECEDDCNSNGLADECDIADETSADCNSNDVPDECDIDSGTSQDNNGDGIPDECVPPVEPLLVDDSLGISCSTDADCPNGVQANAAVACINGQCYTRKNRYLTALPNPLNTAATAVRVSYFDTDLNDWIALGYAGQPDGNGVSRITGTPWFGDPSGTGSGNEWLAVIMMADCEIAPATSNTTGLYRLVVETEAGGDPSASLDIGTASTWGDVSGGAIEPGEGVANFGDILAVVQSFQQSAPHPNSWYDLEPEVPNWTTNFADILQVVQAFQQMAYPYTVPPENCP